MRRAKLSEFRRLIYAPDSAPSFSTIRSRINRREIAGGIREGRLYYVDLDIYFREHDVRAENISRLAELRADPRLKDLM